MTAKTDDGIKSVINVTAEKSMKIQQNNIDSGKWKGGVHEMSSVDWKKLKGPEIDDMIHHAVRHDGKDVRYRNSYIDSYFPHEKVG